MVKKGPFMKISVMGIGPDREKPAGQFEHVVDVACLCGASVHAITQLAGCTEIFVMAVTSGGIAMVLHDLIPKKACGHDISCITRVRVAVG
ncbi:hypothetical protein ES703_110298 [subsurface metagenome]